MTFTNGGKSAREHGGIGTTSILNATRGGICASVFLARDGGKCRHVGCDADAEQVHHLTYERVGYEILDDLVSTCAACHEREHRR